MNKKISSFQLICLAINGDEEALNDILQCYEYYINEICTNKGIDKNGKVLFSFDNELKEDLSNKLITAISKFKI